MTKPEMLECGFCDNPRDLSIHHAPICGDCQARSRATNREAATASGYTDEAQIAAGQEMAERYQAVSCQWRLWMRFEEMAESIDSERGEDGSASLPGRMVAEITNQWIRDERDDLEDLLRPFAGHDTMIAVSELQALHGIYVAAARAMTMAPQVDSHFPSAGGGLNELIAALVQNADVQVHDVHVHDDTGQPTSN